MALGESLRVLAAVIAAGSLARVAPAGAATFTVTDLGDDGSPGQLRVLMNAAAPGDAIVIPAGTITLTGAAGEDLNQGGDLDVAKSLTIQGAGAGATTIDGGAIDGVFDVLVTAHLVMSGVTIRNGQSVQAGGAGIRNWGTLELARSTVTGNVAARPVVGAANFGGGIHNFGTLTLTEVALTGNLARGDGGGLHNEHGSSATLIDVTVSGNAVDRDGGGIVNLGVATLTSVTVSGNNADLSGGGIFTGGAVVTGASTTLTNVTVSGNHANGFGGGIQDSATSVLTNVTVSGNSTTAAASGGGIASAGSTRLVNVLVAGNTSSGVADNCNGVVTSLGHNLDSGSTCALAGPGDLGNTAPGLGPLQDNTGPTWTHALLEGSPAIDAGSGDACPPADQRGVARPQGASCDIGAYEASSTAPPPPPPPPPPDGGGGGSGAGAGHGGGCGSGPGASDASLALAMLALARRRGRPRSDRRARVPDPCPPRIPAS
jgi:hypothetical protein